MPFLRFARDKRGYETTSLVHAFRGRQGRAQQKVLYWFRTPPNVRVGRPALDQEAIRWIEEHNPDIEFDWPKILEATPAPSAPPEDARGRHPRRSRSEQPERSERTGRAERSDRRSPARAAEQPAWPGPDATPPPVVQATDERPATQAPEPEEEALQQITHPDAEEAPRETTHSAVESVLGREQLIRFRARYAELQARIVERGGEPARVEELRAQAEALNPDSWVTVDEARKGFEEFDPKIRELRAALGLKRRRRSRRGGRGRSGPGQTSSADASSNPPSVETPGGQADDDAEDAPADEDEGNGDGSV